MIIAESWAVLAGCICKWTCRPSEPGWVLTEREPRCGAAVHREDPP